MTPLAVLTVSGSDSSAGSGVQGDLKVFAAMRLYGTAVVTAVTSQNTKGVHDVFPMPVTVGMLATAEAAAAVTAKARSGLLPNLVIDPVLAASTGRRTGVSTAIER